MKKVGKVVVLPKFVFRNKVKIKLDYSVFLSEKSKESRTFAVTNLSIKETAPW